MNDSNQNAAVLQRTINYKLKFTDDLEYTFPIHLNAKTFAIINEPKESYPAWTKLECQKCANCPLDEQKHPHCPIAVSIIGAVDFFCKPHPTKMVGVQIETPERTYAGTVDLKTAATSLLGIYMAASGCPIMDKLRPMARFHLPFATAQETTYRAISNYLIAQHLLSLQGKKADWELGNLGTLYQEIETVNAHFRQRLQEVSKHNYALNAVLTLDSFANYINMSLGSDMFYTLENLFKTEDQGKGTSIAPPPQPPYDPEKVMTYEYEFAMEGRNAKTFAINIDRKTLRLLQKSAETLPAWTELTCNKCPNCPLDENKHKHCPAASGVSEAIEFFKETVSTQEGTVTVRTANRSYTKKTSLTHGISSMMGLIMASSGCPIVGRLKPLVRNHLPFATNDETIYRSLGMYLLSQHFAKKHGKTPDWELKNFTKLYEDINIVNKAFCARLRNTRIEDASLNALVKLDCFAQHINFTISQKSVEELQDLFKAYLG